MNKTRALEIFMQHISLATTNGRLFRSTVMAQIISESGCPVASAATRYNDAFKSVRASDPHLVEGLGRQPKAPGTGQVVAMPPSSVADEDDDCDSLFSVLELNMRSGRTTVGRTQCFIMRGDASECFDQRVATNAGSSWVLISGMGPIHGEGYRLKRTERELQRYDPPTPSSAKDYHFQVGQQVVTVAAECVSEAMATVEMQNPGVDVQLVIA